MLKEVLKEVMYESIGLLLANASVVQSSGSDKDTGNKLICGCFSESVTGELLRHVFSSAETKVFRHPFVGLRPDASHEIDAVLSFQVPPRCRCAWRAIAFRSL